jgi:hypothetical protein
MTAVWEHSRAEGSDLLVLLALADIADDDGECWPSVGYLAKKCRIDTRTVQRRIRSLEELSEVVVIRNGGKTRIVGASKSNRYRITIHMPEEDEGGDLPRVAICQGGTGARERVAPLPGGRVAQAPPNTSVDTSVESSLVASASPTLASTRSDLLFDAVIDVCGMKSGELTKTARGGLNKALADLRAVQATPDEVHARAVRYRSQYQNCSLTPMALAKHWPGLSQERSGVSRNSSTIDSVFSQVAVDPRQQPAALR